MINFYQLGLFFFFFYYEPDICFLKRRRRETGREHRMKGKHIFDTLIRRNFFWRFNWKWDILLPITFKYSLSYLWIINVLSFVCWLVKEYVSRVLSLMVVSSSYPEQWVDVPKERHVTARQSRHQERARGSKETKEPAAAKEQKKDELSIIRSSTEPSRWGRWIISYFLQKIQQPAARPVSDSLTRDPQNRE